MPAVLIEVRFAYTPEQERAIMDAVAGALLSDFGATPKSLTLRFVAHAPERFDVDPGLTQPERRTLVTIDCFAGRSDEVKQNLFAAVRAGLEPLGIPADHVSTIIHEVERRNWG